MCKHENADHLFAGDRFDAYWTHMRSIAKCEQLRCLDCGAWLSLGESNDSPPEVRVEIQAAEIAATNSRVVIPYRRRR